MEQSIRENIEKYKICILIPTYNNAKTLSRVLNGVQEYTQHIIIVNDGSSDQTASILQQYNHLKIISLSKNQGKGNALQVGFQEALKMGYEYALTIDSDGQHYPSDIPVFIEKLLEFQKPILLIGSRNMNQDSVPKKSSFGHKFSNFWFHFETGIKLTDTQSGYRLYPLLYIPKKFFTKKFEFEIEIIVRTAWNGIPVQNVPIQVLYDPTERVSHFRPFRDFTRISILNTILVFIAVFYIKPRDFFRNIKKKKLRQFIKEDILEINLPEHTKAFSLALGVFCGIAPFWGFQTFIVIALAVLFKLNKTLAFIGSNISIPPMIPIIIISSLKVGQWIVGGELLPSEVTEEFIKNNILQYLVGSLVLASFSSIFIGLIIYLIFKMKKSTK